MIVFNAFMFARKLSFRSNVIPRNLYCFTGISMLFSLRAGSGNSPRFCAENSGSFMCGKSKTIVVSPLRQLIDGKVELPLTG